MISVNKVSLHYGQRKLFSDVNIIFTPGNCYGLIGANGSGKSTFLKILSDEIDSTAGDIVLPPGKRVSYLKQDQFAFDEYTVLTTVIMGHKRLYDIMVEKETIYDKPDFSDADGFRASELEEEFNELGGWTAESDAAKLLSELDISVEFHTMRMKQLEAGQKVRVLLAQALFGNPDVLLLDEPTNHLDIKTSMWLEEFLCNFENTAIVVSHDRHFLNKICTHISANASKSRQATSRKKVLEKLTLDDISPSSRKYPYINFEQEHEAGNNILDIENLSKSLDGQVMFKDFILKVNKGDKIAFVGPNDLVKTTLFNVLAGEIDADSGSFKWGVSTKQAYYPRDNTKYFNVNLNMIDWLRQWTKSADESFIRGFLGRMLFSGDESLKQVNVLSGGERVRCMFARMMLALPNVMIMDEPNNHLDLESIASLNKGLEMYKGTILFSSHDHQLVQTVANRIIEITPKGYIDRADTTFDEYLTNKDIRDKLKGLY